jgi:hypothetical protein
MTIAGTAFWRDRDVCRRASNAIRLQPCSEPRPIPPTTMISGPYDEPGPCKPRSDPSPSKIEPK